MSALESVLKELLEGHPIGSAMDHLNLRYTEISTDLSEELEDISYGKLADHYEITDMWTSRNDTRNYTIVGDPAVHLVNPHR